MILDLGDPPSIGNQFSAEPRAIPARTFAAYSFLYAYFLDPGSNGDLARDFVDRNTVEFIRSIYELLLVFLCKSGEQLHAVTFWQMCRDGCRCFEITEISEQVLAETVASTECRSISNPKSRRVLGLPSLKSIRQVPAVCGFNVAVAAGLGADRYLSFDASEQKLANEYGLRTDFNEDLPDFD